MTLTIEQEIAFHLLRRGMPVKTVAVEEKREPIHFEAGLHPRDATGRFSRIQVTGKPTDRQSGNLQDWLSERGITEQGVRKHLGAVYDRASPEAREQGMQWYREAHADADRLARRYDVSPEQAAAVIAAMSPRSDWESNKRAAAAVLRAIREPIDLKIEPERADRASKLFKIDVGKYAGKTVNTKDMTPQEVVALRPGVVGLPDNLLKAGRVAAGESPGAVLGGSKVRSFFNNIADPEDASSVTLDTHEIRAAFDSITMTDADYAAIASNPTRYAWFGEVIKTMAKERGLLPNQLQAITWLQWRDEHPFIERRIITIARDKKKKEGKVLDVTQGSSADEMTEEEAAALLAEVEALKADIAADNGMADEPALA